jgi:hypothetical protein
MNAVLVRRKVMNYRDQEFQYESESFELDNEVGAKQTSGKEYRRKRPIRANRRRKSKPANHPGCGIGARRNNRWTW